jgi:protein-disulfide isomerase
VSRAYNAKRKAKRQQERAPAEPQPRVRRRWSPRHFVALVPILGIAAILTVVGISGFGRSSSVSVSETQVDQEVTALLHGIPQKGSALGSSSAPITLRMYADLECPTVKLFVENYLPSLLKTWVRTGAVRLDYRSLETDTSDEKLFFEQEIAALAAGRQNRMWNFLLTFVREQAEPRSDYVTSVFIENIATQVPGLRSAQWHRDRADALLSKRVALGVFSGHKRGLSSTPSFSISFTPGEGNQRAEGVQTWNGLNASLKSILTSLRNETSEDFPTLNTTGLTIRGG